MLNKKLKTGSAIISLVILLSACGQPTTSNLNNVDNGATVISQPSNLKFNKVSEGKVAEYNSLMTQASGQERSVSSSASGGGTSPVAPMVGAASADAIGSSKMAMPSFMPYFPAVGPFEEYTVIDFEEAKTAGFSGTYLDTLNKIVKPVIVGLGGDARMTNSNGSSDGSGVNMSNEPTPTQSATPEMAYYPQYQWQFTYVSSSKKEVYSIFVSTKETLVLKQKWGIKDLSPDDIKIDSNKAIQIVTDSIKNKDFKSPDNQPVYSQPNSETLYEIPANSSWYLYLEKEKGNLIWNVNMNIRYDNPIVRPMVNGNTAVAIAPQAPEYWYSGGYARINASTGEILSLSRPMKYKNVYPEPMPVPPVDISASSSAGSSGSADPATK